MLFSLVEDFKEVNMIAPVFVFIFRKKKISTLITKYVRILRSKDCSIQSVTSNHY
jgi:hypothetical protein